MSRCLIIAEAGINHNGMIELAMHLADDAKAAGADIVKFQTYKTEKILHPEDPSFKELQGYELSHADWHRLAFYCDKIGIEFMTTPGDLESLQFLRLLEVKRIKIGSDDLTNKALVQAAHKTGLPLILSTGMATPAEITEAVKPIDNFSLLHCVSLYPCLSQQANLRSIRFLQNVYSCPVGYSDHTAQEAVVLAAVAAGAEIIEVHFKLDGTITVDDPVSFTTKRLIKLVGDIRETELTLGVYGKQPNSHELAMTKFLRKGEDGLRGIA